MNFTSPAVLWALPAAALPLLLHLLSRRQARHLPFGDLSLLQRVYAKALPRARLRHWLLVAARCLLLACLILAYAGPVLESSSAGSSEGLDLVVLLDGSYSMGAVSRGKPRFERARSAARDVLRRLKPADRAACAVFSDRLEGESGLAWRTPRQCLDLLERAQLGFRGTDYAAALKPAYELLSGSRRTRAVLLLSDGANHGLRGALPVAEPGIQLFGLDWGPPLNNAVVLAAGPAAQSSARSPQLKARVTGSFDAATAAELWVGGAKAQTTALTLRAAVEAGPIFALPAAKDPAAPSWAGHVSLRPDALSADDVYYFSFRHPRRRKVLVLYGNPDFQRAPHGGYFLKELFGGGKQSLLDLDADFIELSRWKEARFSDYATVLLSDFKEAPAAASSDLEAFVRLGGSLWLLPGTRAGPAGFASLNAWLPAEVGPPASASDAYGLKPDPGSAQARLWREFELQRVAVGRYHLLSPRPGAQVLFRSGGGDPLLVCGTRGRGRTCVWASSLDTSWSNLAVKPVFAAWVPAVLDLLTPPDAGLLSYGVKVGEPIVRVWESGEAAPARASVRGPDGRSTAVWLKDRRLEYGATVRPGLYEVTEEGSARKRFYAVNLDRSGGESDLTPAASPPWGRLDPENTADELWRRIYGRDARAAAIAAAAGLLLLEMALALPRSAAAALLLLLFAGPASAQQGDRFVWTQLKIGPTWDPYPSAGPEALGLFGTVTSVLTTKERRVITLKDRALFSSPLVLLAGREAPAPLDEESARELRSYLTAGGMLWIEDTSGAPSSSFDRWVRRTLALVLPESELQALASDHVLYRTFFLLRAPAGRVMVRANLEGVSWGGRTAVLYSRNDLLGAWVKDALGRPLLPCVPGGEAQRHSARKLTLNLLMYSLTGSYKADAVHQPFLLQKFRSGVP